MEKYLIDNFGEERIESFSNIFIVYLEKKEEIIELVGKALSEKWQFIVVTGGYESFLESYISNDKLLVINLSKMKKILDFDYNSGIIEVECGVTVGELNEYLRQEKYNLFFPIKSYGCGKYTTIGGNFASNVYSKYDARYGKINNYVLGIDVIDFKNNNIFLGSRTIKNSTGYNLKSLFAGSRGRLGIISSLVLRLLPLKDNYTAIYLYSSNEKEEQKIFEYINSFKFEILDSAVYYQSSILSRIEFSKNLGIREDKNLFVIDLSGFNKDINKEKGYIFDFAKNNKIEYAFSTGDDFYLLNFLELDNIFENIQINSNRGILFKFRFDSKNFKDNILKKLLVEFKNEKILNSRIILDLFNFIGFIFIPIVSANKSHYENICKIVKSKFNEIPSLKILGEATIGFHEEKVFKKEFSKEYIKLEEKILNIFGKS